MQVERTVFDTLNLADADCLAGALDGCRDSLSDIDVWSFRIEGELREGPDSPRGEWPQWKLGRQESFWRYPPGSPPMRGMRLRDDPFLHEEGRPALSLLHMLEGYEARPRHLPD